MAQIKQVGMTRPRFERGRPGPVRVVVMHATAGLAPGDYNWLRQGGGDKQVSIHYYIDKAGNISQMVQDGDTAWQAGLSEWTVDGKRVTGTLNPISIGIELENRNTGRDPYPPAQYAAALDLTRLLVTRYNIPRRQLVRHLDISPRRKTDPAGFPWERFLNDVYGGAPSTTPTTPVPPVETLPPDQAVRRLLVDLAYRAAGGGVASGWPLLKEAVSRATGMPVAILSTPTGGEGETEDDSARPLLLPGVPPLLAEAYGRDLFYALVDQPNTVMRLSESGAGPVRDGLLKALFAQADPAHGYHPEWGFHQQWAANQNAIGVPLGPNHLLAGKTSDGRQWAAQHFAGDSLCSPTNDYKTIIRLSQLTRDMYGSDPHTPVEKSLRTLLLNDLYQLRTGRNFDPGALFCRFAIINNIGAPTAKAEIQSVGAQKFVAMAYACDVLYCRIPPDGNWDRVAVGVLGLTDDSGLGRLSQMLSAAVLDADASATPGVLSARGPKLPEKVYGGGVLGRSSTTPTITDLASLGLPGTERGGKRGGAAVELVVVYPTYGRAVDEIAAAAAADAPVVWHYYVASDGTISKLVDERLAAKAAAGQARWDGQGSVNQRSIAVAVEGAALAALDAASDQGRALAWLLADITKRNTLTRAQVIQAADLVTRVGPAWDEMLKGM